MLRNKKGKNYEAIILEQIQDINNLYQEVKNEERGYQPRAVYYKDKNGESCKRR